MMTRVRSAALLLLAVVGALPAAKAFADETIVIIRHAEKPALGLGQLSCQGLNRSLALPDVLLARFGRPTAIFAPNPAVKKSDKGVPYAYIRPLATVEPLAIRVGEPVNIDWGMADVGALAKHLLARKDGTYVIAWEHHYGENLAKILLAALDSHATVPDWDNADFDSIYVIRIASGDGSARLATFAHEQQGLNSLPEACGTGPR